MGTGCLIAITHHGTCDFVQQFRGRGELNVHGTLIFRFLSYQNNIDKLEAGLENVTKAELSDVALNRNVLDEG